MGLSRSVSPAPLCTSHQGALRGRPASSAICASRARRSGGRRRRWRRCSRAASGGHVRLQRPHPRHLLLFSGDSICLFTLFWKTPFPIYPHGVCCELWKGGVITKAKHALNRAHVLPCFISLSPSEFENRLGVC